MITKVSLNILNNPQWFACCQDAMKIIHNCRRVKKSRYYSAQEVMNLTGTNYRTLFNMLAGSISMHAFMYQDKLFIHPTGFERWLMDKMRTQVRKETRKEKVEMTKEYIH